MVTPPRALGFTVTNLGSGSEALSLAANVAMQERGFSPTLKQIMLDTDGDGRAERVGHSPTRPASTTPCSPPGKSIMVWAVCDMPASLYGGR